MGAKVSLDTPVEELVERFPEAVGFLSRNRVRCIRCGEPPTSEGHDACLGYIPGIKSACCGHGVEAAYEVRI